MTMTTFTIILFGSSLIVAYTATLAWRRRDVTGGAALTLMFVAVAIWCFFSAMGTTTTSASERYIWAACSYIGVVNVGPFFLVFACQYSDSRWRLYNGVLILVWSIPVITLALVFTNDFHHLIWSRITSGPILGTRAYHYGPWFMVEILWSFGLCAVGSFHLLRVAARAARCISCMPSFSLPPCSCRGSGPCSTSSPMVRFPVWKRHASDSPSAPS